MRVVGYVPNPDGPRSEIVFERDLEHLVRHSPTGFEYGYGGSGPADLARSMVGDVLDTDDPHPHYYQAVKFALLANPDLPEQFELTREDVLVVMETQEPAMGEGA